MGRKIKVEILPVKKKPFRLLYDIEVKLPNGRMIVVRKGYRYDLASVPSWLHWLVPIWGRDNIAFLAHDYIYDNEVSGFTRRQADKIMFKLAVRSGASPTRAYIMYLGVRAGGWVGWRRNRK